MHKPFQLLSLIILVSTIPLFCLGQSEKYLLIKKRNNPGGIFFYPGDEIRLKLKLDKEFLKGKITGFYGDTALRVNDFPINIFDISEIDIRRKKRSQAPKIILAGMLYPIIALLNNAEPGAIIGPSVSLVVLGTLLYLGRKKEIKVGGRNHLLILGD